MPKLGLGLYKSLLTKNNFEFARQAGATHLVVQLVDYIKEWLGNYQKSEKLMGI